LYHNSCGAKQPTCKCYQQSTIKREETDFYTFPATGPGQNTTRTARLSPKDKDERIKKFSTCNPVLNVRAETPAPNTATRQRRLPMQLCSSVAIPNPLWTDF